jgi:excisionase family DNA binding protein
MNDSLDRLSTRVVENGALLTVDDCAQVLGVSSGTIRRMVDSGELPASQLGGLPHRPIRISASALHERLAGWSTRG